MLVVALHAALLVGLPQLRLGAGASRIDVGAFTTRRIAAPAPTVDPATEPPPRPTERPTAKALPPKPAAAAKKRESAPPQPATAPGPTRNAGPISSAEPSLLNAKPTGTGSFGGLTAPTPIEAPMSASATEPALALAQTLGDTPVRIPRAAELTYQAQGTIGGQAFTVPVTLQWRQDGHWYESRFGFYNPRVGERTRQVAGLITPQGLAPAVVQMRVPDAQDIRFDYGSGRVSFSASGTDAPLVAGMQDRLSVLIQLGALLAGVVLGVVPAASAFSGFSDDVVVIVGAALVISHAVARSGAVETLMRPLTPYLRGTAVQVPVLVGVTVALVRGIGISAGCRAAEVSIESTRTA